jgi:hypothetical protein
VPITQFFRPILRWVLTCFCVACDKKISDLDNACHTCPSIPLGAVSLSNRDRLMGPEVARVPVESNPRSERRP